MQKALSLPFECAVASARKLYYDLVSSMTTTKAALLSCSQKIHDCNLSLNSGLQSPSNVICNLSNLSIDQNLKNLSHEKTFEIMKFLTF